MNYNKYIKLLKIAEFLDNNQDYKQSDHLMDNPLDISDEELKQILDKALYEYNFRKNLHEKGELDPLFDSEGPSEHELIDIEGERLVDGW
jgi:hypothetical protein